MTSQVSFSRFKEIDTAMRAERPKVFQLTSPDRVATEATLIEIESKLGIQLPSDYREFLKGYGGGDFGFTNIFSADPESEWFLPKMQKAASVDLPEGLLAFSDDFSGGYYVFLVENGIAEHPVYYWNQDGGLISTEFESILAYVVRYAYQPA
jgi:hypothetical protein